MTIINATPDRTIQLGYEGEDRVTVLRFRYSADWLENGSGIFHIRVRRHGEHTAYNAQLVADDAENHCLLMTVTDVELSVRGAGEMQVVYSGADFVKKSPIYSYNVSRAVDEAVDPPAQDVYTQIIENLSDLQTDVQELSDAVDGIGNLADLTTTAKTDLVSAINEVNAKGGGGGGGLVTVDDALSTTSTNPVQNKVVTSAVQGKADIQTVSALADAVQGLDGDVQGLQTTVQAKADTATVTALSGTVSGLQTAIQGKADTQTVTALSGIVTGLQTSKADKSYVDTELAGKASTATATTSSDGLMSAQDKSRLDAIPNFESEVIAEVTVSESSDLVSITTDTSGKAFSLRTCKILVEMPASTTGTADHITVQGIYRKSTGQDVIRGFPTMKMASASGSKFTYEYECFPGGLHFMRGFVAGSFGSTATGYSVILDELFLYLKGVRVGQHISSSTLIPVGTKIKIIGIRL